jgi:multidrug efflux pump subunit AcrB
MTHLTDGEPIKQTHNSARFFTENRHISWVLLFAVFLWGYYGYSVMPKRKDPNVPINIASVVTPWPGKTAEDVEQLVTYPIEQTIAENSTIRTLTAKDWGLQSTSLPGVSIVQVRLSDTVTAEGKLKQFNDINLKLNDLNASLPPGAGPIQFNSGYSDTAALVLEVVSPSENEVELSLRARDIRRAIEAARRGLEPREDQARAALVVAFPRKVSATVIARILDLFMEDLQAHFSDGTIQRLAGAGFAGLDIPAGNLDDGAILSLAQTFLDQRLGLQQFHPDAWAPVVIRDPAGTLQKLTETDGDRYSYRELDDITDLIARNLSNVPQVSKVERSGVLPEQIALGYSQEQLASYGLQPDRIQERLNARNIANSGGSASIGGINLALEPSGEFTREDEIGGVVVARDQSGLPVYLRSLVDIHRGYQYPPRFLNCYAHYDEKSGRWKRNRAVAVAVFMRDGEQLGDFDRGVTEVLDRLKTRLPDGLLMLRVSDQAQQAAESIRLFTTALYEAIIMIVLFAWVGFRSWRPALVMLLAIPLTMAMTFGMIDLLGIDVQQVSIAALIIALGLLVDDPVVASDAVQRHLAAGHPPLVAAWLGPTKLAKAIMFATLTNVAAYLPLLLLHGDIGRFLYSLPVVMASALIASRIVSMTFIPLLGYYLLRPPARPEPSIEDRRSQGFTGVYYRIGGFAIDHRKSILLVSLLVLVMGGVLKSRLVDSFFPYDVQYLSYADVWLRNNATLQSTAAAAEQAMEIVEEVSREYGEEQRGETDKPRVLLDSVSAYVGGSGPKFWFSVISQLHQLNYAQLVMRVTDKDATPALIERWQGALSERIPDAIIDVKQLQTQPVNYPVGIRLSSRAAVEGPRTPEDIHTLRQLGEAVKAMLRSSPITERISDDWGDPDLTVRLEVEPDRANLAGITNSDVAYSTALALNGVQMTTLREGDKQVPVVMTLRLSERAQLSDLQNLYVYPSAGERKIPLSEVATIDYTMETGKIVRTGHFRSLTVYAYPVPGAYPSQVMNELRPQLAAFQAALPPGYELQVTGVEASSKDSNGQLVNVLFICIGLIYIALVAQFANAVKPFLVFAAVPYGVCGAFAALYFMGSSFGFMAFLGIVALIGVIVSHVIVLFDFVEDAHQRGEPLREALLDAGVIRLRPVLITVGATILALVPLAIHGGPLWQPLCYAQIGGLAFATIVTLILVPTFYSIFVLDLKIVQWKSVESRGA